MLWALFLAPVSILAQLGGSTSFAALDIPYAPRAAALGGNNIAVRDGDLNLALMNPALLDSLAHQQLSMGYLGYFAGSRAGYASYGHHVDSLATFSASVSYLGYGDFDRTDETGQVIGNFTANDFIFSLSGAVPIDTAWTIGASAKFIYSAVDSYYSAAAALDLGGSYFNPAKRFSAGLVVRNLGVQFNTYFEEVKEDLPFQIQLGIAKQFKHAPFRFTIVAENLQTWDLTYSDPNAQVIIDPITGEVIGDTTWEFGDRLMRHMVFGAEFLLGDNFHARMGYNYRRRQELKVNDKPGTAGFSWGFGMRVKRFDVNYTRATYSIAGATNQLSIATGFTNW